MRRSLTVVAMAWLAAFAAGPAAGQEAGAIGIVTALSGGAEVARVPGGLPAPLAFKDRVLAGDAIATAERSVARVLLGGKALLTVRELSRVRVGPGADRLSVTLESGRVALSVVAERLAPGEAIEVRTPNGSARVRGGTVVVEATRASAQVGPGPLAMVSTISVIQGPTSVQVALTQAQMTASQTVMITGFILGPIRAMTPAMLAALARDLLMPLQHYESALKATVSQTQLDQAAALAAVLAAGPSAEDRQLFQLLLSELEARLGHPLVPFEISWIGFHCPPDCHGELVGQSVTGPGGSAWLMGVFDDVTVDRPMLTVTDSFIGGVQFVFATSHGTLTSTTTEPLVQFTRSLVQTQALLGLYYSQSVTLNGTLFQDTGGRYDLACCALLVGEPLTTTSTTEPLMRFTDSRVTNGQSNSVLGGTFATLFGGPINLGGSLLDASNSHITSAGSLVFVGMEGSSLTSASPSALVKLDGGTLSVQVEAPLKAYDYSPAGFFFNYGLIELNGPLLQSTNTQLAFGRSVVGLDSREPGVVVLKKDGTAPLLSITGPASFTHSLTNDPDYPAMVWIGVGPASFTLAVDPDPDAFGIQVNTDQPLRSSAPDGALAGSVLQTDGASVKTQSLLLIDVATLAASAPILDLRNGSTFEATADLITVGIDAKLASVGSVVRLDASTLRVGGAVVSVGSYGRGSFLKVTGDLVTLGNGSTLQTGTLLFVGGNGMVSISGALVNFTTASGNTVRLTNSLCPCTTIGGIPVALTGGATAAQVSIAGTPIKNLGTNTFNPTGGAAIRVDGPTGRVTVRGL